jgi:hypothetical protein
MHEAAHPTQSKRGLLTRLRDNISAVSHAQQASLPPAEESVQLPPGAQSVVAANNGYAPRYVPVPMMTVPQPVRPPSAPTPPMPQPPDPAAYVNAFQPPQPPAQAQQQQAAAFNAFQRVAQQQMLMQQYGYPPQSYAQMPGQMPMYNPQMMAYHQQAQAYPQQMYQQYMPSYSQRPQAHFNVATAYPGPMPPNPVQQVQAQMHMQQYAHMAMPNPAMDRPAAYQMPSQDTATVAQHVTMLQGSPYPAQREWAANNLTTLDWHKCPEILPAMLLAAQHDPAATVRAACIYNVSRKGIALPVVLATFEMLKNDADPRVRHQAIQACSHLRGTTPPQAGITHAN